MSSKTEEKYEKLFAAFKILNAMLHPHKVTINFVIAAFEDIKSSFPKANIKHCLIHLAQANRKKRQCLGLVIEYKENTDVQIVLKLFLAPALIPE